MIANVEIHTGTLTHWPLLAFECIYNSVKQNKTGMDGLWGKLDSKYVDKKTTKSSKSPSIIKDFEGYFKPKKEHIFSLSPLSSPIQLRKSLSNRKDTSCPSPSPRKLDLNYMYAEM